MALHFGRPRGELRDGARRTDTCRREGGTRGPAQLGAEDEALAVESDVDGAHFGEVTHQVGPARRVHSLVEALLQIDLEPEREEAADDVSELSVVAKSEGHSIAGTEGRRRSEGQLRLRGGLVCEGHIISRREPRSLLRVGWHLQLVGDP